MIRVPYSLSVLGLLSSLLVGCGGGDSDPSAPATTAATPAPTVAAPAQPAVHRLSGTVAGLSGNGLVLVAGADTLPVAAGATSFTMPSSVVEGAAYAITVRTQPVGQTCSVANGAGTMGQADAGNAVVTCAANAHRLGGNIAGLTAGGLVLANAADLVVVLPGATHFSFATAIAEGSSYAATVQSQPTGMSCALVGGNGTMGSQDVADLAVTCTTDAHAVGGTIAGLSASGLVLANGSDTLAVGAGATSFAMPHGVAFNGAYAVTVQVQPVAETCSVANGAGTMAATNVANVVVTCAVNTHHVGGTVSGLSANGLVLANGGDTVAVAANAATFALPTAVAEGGAYGVTVQTQPAALTCSIANGGGVVGTADIGDVAVTCAPTGYTLGGSITGLDFNGLVLANGSDTLNVAANATVFTMPNPVVAGSGYAVVVQGQPAYKQCTITNGAGTMPAAAVTTVAVDCVSIAQVSTIAGTAGVHGAADGTGAAASFYQPFGIAMNSAGDFFVGDLDNNEVRRVTAAGVVTTFAGSTTYGNADGTGSAARFHLPAGVAVDRSDNVYVFDLGNYSVRRITPGGVVTTLAGSGAPGSADGTGTAASFSGTYGLAVDSQGNVFVADGNNNRIRKVTPAGVVTTFAGSGVGSADGTGTSATFTYPYGIAVDANDNLYVADTGNHKIRKITPAGVVTTIAGSGTPGSADGTGTAASFNAPYGLAVAPNGTIYVADTFGNRIRKVTPAGVVTTIAGASGQGHADGPGATATFSTPTTIAIDAAGNLFVVDYTNYTIRKVIP